mmetsp:Transcript_80626/g.195477  ORF Transcript_80626/g.195477 Transcript_80626/m.195477 type:complete len:210 (-) Transcript_80626:363-992(-)
MLPPPRLGLLGVYPRGGALQRVALFVRPLLVLERHLLPRTERVPPLAQRLHQVVGRHSGVVRLELRAHRVAEVQVGGQGLLGQRLSCLPLRLAPLRSLRLGLLLPLLGRPLGREPRLLGLLLRCLLRRPLLLGGRLGRVACLLLRPEHRFGCLLLGGRAWSRLTFRVRLTRAILLCGLLAITFPLAAHDLPVLLHSRRAPSRFQPAGHR